MNELKSADQLVEDYRKFSNKKCHLEDSNVKWNVRCNACHEPLTIHEAAKVIHNRCRPQNHFVTHRSD